MDSKLSAVLTEMIPRSAGGLMRIAKVPGGMVSKEDIKQEMWLAAAEQEGLLLTHLANGNTSAIRTVLMSAAKRAIQEEHRQQRIKKAALAGYEPHDEVFYTTGALRRLLPMYLDALDEDGIIPERPPQGREHTGKVSGSVSYGDYLATMADVDRAFKALSESKQKLLGRYFAYPQGKGGWTHTEISSAMGMPPDELNSRVQVAVNALQRELGGQNPWNKGPTPKRGG